MLGKVLELYPSQEPWGPIGHPDFWRHRVLVQHYEDGTSDAVL